VNFPPKTDPQVGQSNGSKGGREMGRRLYPAEQIIGKLRETEVAGIGGCKSA